MVTDPAVQTVANTIGIPDYTLDAVRSIQGVKYAVPLFSGGALVKLENGTYQAVNVVGLDDTSLFGRPEMEQGHIDDIFAENSFMEIPPTIPAELLERRPDIAGAERNVAAANAQIGVAKAAYYPNISLGPSAGIESLSFTDWFTWPSRFWSLGPAAAETIFDAGARRAAVQQARAAHDASVANYRQTVLVSFQQVEDNLAALRILSEDLKQQDAAVQSAKRFFRQATARNVAGPIRS